MNNYEIESALSAYGVRALCAEELPITVRAGCFVVNTDHCGNAGKHWTVFYFPKGDKPAEFFDSLGRAPGYYHSRFEHILMANGPRYKYLRDRLQAVDSEVCGQYCIYYVEQRKLGRSMADICRDFRLRRYRENDEFVNNIFLNKVNYPGKANFKSLV